MNLNMKNYLMAILLMGVSLFASAQQTDSGNASYVLKVEGTALSHFHSVMEVLQQVPGVSVYGSEVEVENRGVPAIYINNRKIADNSELWHIVASKVKEVEVMYQPGSEYGKDVQAVVVVRLAKDWTEGLSVDEMLRFDLTHRLSTSNELGLGWKHKALTIGAFLAYNEERRRNEMQTFNYHYRDQQLISHEDEKIHRNAYTQRLTGRLNASYAFSDQQSLSFNYSASHLRRDRTFVPEVPKTSSHPDMRHDIGMEFAGKFGAWDLTVGNNTFFDDIDRTAHNPSATSYYLRDEYDIRSYAKAGVPLWKGKLLVGAEHEFDHMDVTKYDDKINPDPDYSAYGRLHAVHPDHTYALFVSSTQHFGSFTVEGGLRYEHLVSSYKPCADDGLQKLLKELCLINPTLLQGNNRLLLLARDGRLRRISDFLYPTLRLSTAVGASELSLIHTQSSVRPYLGLTRLTFEDVQGGHLDDRILWTEKVATTSLLWKYRSLGILARHTHYTDPICSTFDGTRRFNAPDYEALDLNAALAPAIGLWSPTLNVNLHKQWFDMPLANGKNKLRRPLCTVSMKNILTLPSNWLLLVSADWHSRGAERNFYHYSPDFLLDASVQKEFPRQHLTFVLGANNILRQSFLDVTRYTQAFNNISEGERERVVRTVSLSVKWKL